MESYLMMLYVTLDQESALKTFFSQQGWAFLKPDLSVITDKLGPVISLSTQTPIPAQATCTFPAETDTVSTVPENTVHIVTETDRLSTVPENTIHIQLETLDQPDVKSRSSRKRSSLSDQTKPVAKLPRIKLQLSNTSSSAELAEKEQSEPIVQLENASYEPVFVDDVNRIVVKEEAVDSDYEPDNDNVDDNENTDIDESFKQISADNDASGSQDVTEGDGEQEDETGAGTEERRTQKQPKNTKLKYRAYSPTSMKNAIMLVRETGAPIRMAARQFGVPEASLRHKLSGRVNPDAVRSGPPPLFSQEEEAVFVRQLKLSASVVGHGFSRLEIQEKASEYAVCLGKRDKDNPLSLRWCKAFMKRWPELRLAKLEIHWAKSQLGPLLKE